MTLLTGAQTSVQPIANPVKNRPIRINVLNPAGLFQFCANASRSHPLRFGIDDIISAGLRPNPSAVHPAIELPNKAPNGANDCRKKATHELKKIGLFETYSKKIW